jgi:hypothetical protein
MAEKLDDKEVVTFKELQVEYERRVATEPKM